MPHFVSRVGRGDPQVGFATMVDRLGRRDSAVARRPLLHVFLFSAIALLASLSGCTRAHGPHLSPAILLSAQNSKVEVLPAEQLDADGVDESVVLITAYDVNGHIVAGVSAVISASGTDNVLTQPFTDTNPLGQCSGRIAATSAGARVL